MPLKLIPPRQGASSNWRVRGTYLKCYVDQSTGACTEALAKKFLKKVKDEIERGAFKKKDAIGFGAAAAAYMNAGGDATYLAPIIEYFKDKSLTEIDQIAIDNCAAALYPDVTAPTRCRQVYTPISAVMHRAGDLRPIKRPKGSKSSKRISWLRPEQAFALFAAADADEPEFGLLLRLFSYTGMRRSEVLAGRDRPGRPQKNGLRKENIDLKNATIYLPKTKNSDPRQVHLTPELVAGFRLLFASHPELGAADPVFRYRTNGYLQDKLARAMKAAGLSFPAGQNGWHLFRHTWAMWMRKFGGLDTSGLVETGAWRDRASAARYEHLDATEEAQKADLLPVMPKLLTDQRRVKSV